MSGLALQVLDKFALYSGQEPEEAAMSEDICEGALEDVLSDIASNINIDEHKSKICCIAAALALYRFTLQKDLLQDGADITIGNVRVGAGSNISSESAYKFYAQLRGSAKALFQDDCFYFGRVKV